MTIFPAQKHTVSRADPTNAMDETAGYYVGSTHTNQSTGTRWTCVDTTLGAPSWEPDSQPRNCWINNEYLMPHYVTGVNDGQPAANVQIFLPVWFDEVTYLDRLGVVLTTAQAGAKVRLGIYYAKYGRPHYLRKEFGEIDLSSGSGLKSFSNKITVKPGHYFLSAIMATPSATQATVKKISGANFGVFSTTAAADVVAGTPGFYLSTAQTYGALPFQVPNGLQPASGNDGIAIVMRKLAA